MNQRLYGIWLGDVFFSFSGEISESRVDAWVLTMRRLQSPGGARPFQQAALRIAELRWPAAVPREQARRGERRGLTGRSLEGLALSPKDTWSMLFAWEEAGLEAQGVTPGGEMTYWREAARFAQNLLQRGKIVPGSAPAAVPGGRRRGTMSAIRAVWCPLLDLPEDEERFRRLAAAMPPIGLAQIRTPAEEETQSTEQRQLHVLHSFISALIDVKVQETVQELGRELRKARANYRRGYSPLSELWWNNLTGPGYPAEIQGTAAEIGELEAAIAGAGGVEPQERADHSPQAGPGFNLCLRLEPPERWEEHPYWMLSFWAESREDPSLRIAADGIWSSTEPDLPLGGSVYKDVQTEFLLSLYKAAGVSPEVRAALNISSPEGTELTQEEVYRFLSRTVPLLRRQGITVQMPSRWTKEGKRRAGVKLRARSWDQQGSRPAKTDFGMQQLVTFKLEAMLGDRMLSLEELEELAGSKVPLVFFQGEWIEIDVKEIRQMLKYMKKHEEGSMTFAEMMHLAADPDLDEQWEGMYIAGFEMEGLLQALVQGDALGCLEKRPVPKTLQGTLRPYQERGFQWLSLMKRLGFGALLADDMGLGKTVQVITAMLDGEKGEEKKGEGACLIICPTSLLGNWQRELKRFAPQMSVYIHHGGKRLHGEEFTKACQTYDVVLTTYQLAGRDAAEMRELDWSAIVLDEAQYIKNFGTKQAQSVMKLRAPQRIAMTGTPVENRLGELWSIFQFLNPGYLGTAASFRRQYAAGGEGYPEELARLRKLVAPFLLRRLKSDPDISKDLPKKIEMKSYCSLTSEQAALYKNVTDELMSRIGDSQGIARKGLVLSSLTKLKQICDHPALQTDGAAAARASGAGRSGKLERLLELADTVTENGEAALIFTQYVRMGELLVRHIRSRYGFEPYFLHGSLPKRERDEMVRTFQDGSGPPIFILSLKAGGVGLNLTRANHVIHYDRWWNPAVENQATDRVFRIGQEKNVEVHKLICQGTLEERIDELIERKRSLSEQVVGSGEQWLTEMSTEELQDLITLQTVDWT
ncbi:DEAD/DEAH box helicase [Paenibacillus pinistramenti]|uniref:DEAD/DEAH box helicase n=1 Tax=Paenibacillus pinistramenti TaxID=1768003 RepID=UPI00110917BA|nr:DEAD/DEAH box helicase [Paenibacillus pinistramenti]